MLSAQQINEAFRASPSRKAKRQGVLYSSPKCPNLDLYVVERTTTSPTITIQLVEREGVLGQPQSVTPYHLMGRLGIGAYNSMNPSAGGDIDSHYSVYSYLWAMEYFGLMTYIAKWPKEQSWPKRDGVLTPYGYRFGAHAYRPEYAFVALLSFMGWNEPKVANFVRDMLALPRSRRLASLQKTAAYYLQNQVDANAETGFHSLVSWDNFVDQDGIWCMQ